ncbi:hypothetical protein ADK70_38630 [Streptomyces rimosus subsp. pseudoverticillatus]|uniref:hypothetical protein n=1 Tax=Streptomyces rimosus TaxID=1927 RepID=UPI0006B292AF|nr:hypothetical protein [Streptomyces rimosus]KOT76390.1 hypothetical protein ADK70_38630 [Streptomyces rimosus subsp. pseudoverticillatus]
MRRTRTVLGTAIATTGLAAAILLGSAGTALADPEPPGTDSGWEAVGGPGTSPPRMDHFGTSFNCEEKDGQLVCTM